MRLQLQGQCAQLRRREIGAKTLGTQLLLTANVERVQVVPGAKDEGVYDEREVGDRRELAERVAHDFCVRQWAPEHDPGDRRSGQVERDDERNRDCEVRWDAPAPPRPLDRESLGRPDDGGCRDTPQEQKDDLFEHRRAKRHAVTRRANDEQGKDDDVQDRGEPQRDDDSACGRPIRGEHAGEGSARRVARPALAFQHDPMPRLRRLGRGQRQLSLAVR
jgi:hypothetical protein